jgi:serine/threonine-protein kinase
MPKKLYGFLLFSLLFLNVFFLTAVVSFHVTKRGETVSVPDLSGMSLEEARGALEELKLSLIQSGIELHAQYEKGQIIAQAPLPKTRSHLNTVVRVVVSAGKEKVTVPDFQGRSLQAILPSLGSTGVRKGNITHVHSSRYSAGRIIGQYPLAGQEVPVQSPINFLVSEGEEEETFLMPDLLGRQVSHARKTLGDMGFRLGPIRRSYYRGYEPGIIINQSPSQGSIIKKRNTIILEVTK